MLIFFFKLIINKYILFAEMLKKIENSSPKYFLIENDKHHSRQNIVCKWKNYSSTSTFAVLYLVDDAR